MKIINCSQGDETWFKTRVGIPTSSNFDRIITTEGKPSKQAQKYMLQLAAERITGKPEDSYKSPAMQRGNELEAQAREFYELITGDKVQQVGFCLVETEEGFKWGSSPDGLIGEDGGLEIKSPLAATHIEYLLNNKFPMEYYQQVQGNMMVTGRKWWELLSFHPDMRPFRIRIERNSDFIFMLRNEIVSFCLDLDLLVTKIKEK